MRSIEETGTTFPTTPRNFRTLALEAPLLETQLCYCVNEGRRHYCKILIWKTCNTLYVNIVRKTSKFKTETPPLQK